MPTRGDFAAQKHFYKPGSLEYIEDGQLTGRELPKFTIGTDSPLLARSRNQLSTNRIPSLARISTWNSSLTHVPSATARRGGDSSR